SFIRWPCSSVRGGGSSAAGSDDGVLAEPVREELVALVHAHAGCPAQPLAGAALVEPVRGGHLLGQELRHRRLVVTGALLPDPLDHPPREAGGGTGDAQRRGGHSGGTAPAGEHVADRAGLAV